MGCGCEAGKLSLLSSVAGVRSTPCCPFLNLTSQTTPTCRRVLGGGVVPGSLVLVGGDPGVGECVSVRGLGRGGGFAGRGEGIPGLAGWGEQHTLHQCFS